MPKKFNQDFLMKYIFLNVKSYIFANQSTKIFSIEIGWLSVRTSVQTLEAYCIQLTERMTDLVSLCFPNK